MLHPHETSLRVGIRAANHVAGVGSSLAIVLGARGVKPGK
jgi:hypothetical protein